MFGTNRFLSAVIRWLIVFLLGIFMGVPQLAMPVAYAYESPLEIRSISLDSSGNFITIQGNRNLAASKYYTVLKLPGPDRIILDIPDAVLGTASPFIPVHKKGIQEIQLSESRGTFYNAVRVTIFLESNELLQKSNITVLDKSLVVSLSEVPNLAKAPEPVQRQNQAPVPVTPNANIISDVFYRDGQLVIRGNSNSKLLVKNRFVLADPGRLVLDFDHSVVSSKGILKPISVNGENIKQIRVGQFDEDTVRIVIEALTPERLQMIYPGPDKTLLSISADMGPSITALPSDTQLGQIQKVNVRKDNGDTLIQITTNAPIVQQIIKDQDKVYVELQNIAGTPGVIPFDHKLFPQLETVRVENLTAGQPNSKLVINMKSQETEVASYLSPDGKTIEIALMGSRLGNQRNYNGRMAKAPYAARVVIDAGHGGKDIGANREGINEKDLNLAVALRLKQALEARGLKVFMTRSTDIFLPLPEISRITNEIHPDLFVSVHTNSSNSPSITGLETYYYTPQSAELAKQVHARLVNAISSPDRGVRTARFYVIHHTPVPAILCEMGYISNAGERSQLITATRAQKTAEAIADGVVEYLKVRLSAKAR